MLIQWKNFLLGYNTLSKKDHFRLRLPYRYDKATSAAAACSIICQVYVDDSTCYLVTDDEKWILSSILKYRRIFYRCCRAYSIDLNTPRFFAGCMVGCRMPKEWSPHPTKRSVQTSTVSSWADCEQKSRPSGQHSSITKGFSVIPIKTGLTLL